MSDAVAALAFLRALPDVDARRVALVGHSFGGSLSLILAAHDTLTRASVVFGPAAWSWAGSPELQARLRSAVASVRSPVFFIHAANDYSTTPGKVLAAEMQRLGKPHRLQIYPAFGSTAAEGHDLIFLATRTWESDVFAFLDGRMRR
jgi:carboxymethylenebutenolidase